jgi:RNA polymerase sigma-70 factor (ECF subfamily)
MKDAVESAFADRHREAVYRVCLRALGCPHAAEDAAQEALIHALKGRAGCSGDESAWVRRIALRAAWRELRRWPSTGVSQPPLVREPEAQRRAEVRDALARLRPAHRIVLVMAASEGMTHEEIAEALGIPSGTVASRLSAAKKAFIRQWGENP